MRMSLLAGRRVLLVEADGGASARLEAALAPAGARVVRAADGAEAFHRLCEGAWDAVVAGSPPRDVPPAEIARWAAAWGDPPLVEAAGDGALVERIGAALAERLARTGPAGDFVGTSAAAEAVRRRIVECAANDAPVLISGETGVGKEVVAGAIHRAGGRGDGPFVPLNCAAVPEALLEGELFGALRGAYTGAHRDRPGLLAAAAGGTVFLDEIGELSPAAQAKLLRFLDRRSLRPLGATAERCVDVRIVAATHRDLGEEVRAGRFREDLYFRLDVLRVAVPPLRERRADVPVLARHFAARLAGGADGAGLAPEALRQLLAHDWPGNARELQNAIARAFARQGPCIQAIELPGLPGAEPTAPGSPAHLDALLRRHRGDVGAVARHLGVSPRTVQRRLARLGLRADAYRRKLARAKPGARGEPGRGTAT